MRAARVLGIGAAVAAVLYAALDSGWAGVPPPRLASLSLGGLGVLFGFGAWVMSVGGRPERAPLLAGLSLGVGSYALARLFLP